MKRSEINAAYRAASLFFSRNGWVIRPHFRWDVTDFGLGDFKSCGLVLINLADEPEYCEKLMYAAKGQLTPAHYHRLKKEDIICRTGILAVRLWPEAADELVDDPFTVRLNGQTQRAEPGAWLRLEAGDRVTIAPGIWHEFHPESDACIIGEVSTANDDAYDNVFQNPNIGRYPDILEDEIPLIRLVSDFQSMP